MSSRLDLLDDLCLSLSEDDDFDEDLLDEDLCLSLSDDEDEEDFEDDEEEEEDFLDELLELELELLLWRDFDDEDEEDDDEDFEDFSSFFSLTTASSTSSFSDSWEGELLPSSEATGADDFSTLILARTCFPSFSRIFIEPEEFVAGASWDSETAGINSGVRVDCTEGVCDLTMYNHWSTSFVARCLTTKRKGFS